MAIQKGLMIPVTVCTFMFGISGALGQGSPQERGACRHDVRRFCQTELQRNPNDALSITGCLQANRAKISGSCRGTLTRHGQ